jgi:hypothetical protein
MLETSSLIAEPARTSFTITRFFDAPGRLTELLGGVS